MLVKIGAGETVRSKMMFLGHHQQGIIFLVNVSIKGTEPIGMNWGIHHDHARLAIC